MEPSRVFGPDAAEHRDRIAEELMLVVAKRHGLWLTPGMKPKFAVLASFRAAALNWTASDPSAEEQADDA